MTYAGCIIQQPHAYTFCANSCCSMKNVCVFQVLIAYVYEVCVWIPYAYLYVKYMCCLEYACGCTHQVRVCIYMHMYIWSIYMRAYICMFCVCVHEVCVLIAHIMFNRMHFFFRPIMFACMLVCIAYLGVYKETHNKK